MDENKVLEQKERIQKAGSLHWIHWAVVTGSLLLTIVAWYYTSTQVEEKKANRFGREASHVVELLSERMQKYEEALWGGVAAFQSQEQPLTAAQWKRFADTLQIGQRYPGINGIGVIFEVSPEKLAAFIANERHTRPNFRIHPRHTKNEFWPITYIEPVASNSKALGLDMAHETNRHAAAKKARDAGTTQITGPIVLVQDAERTPGFLFYAPFYGGKSDTLVERRRNFGGLVYAPFIFRKLMEGTLKQEKRHVTIQVKDGGEILYNEHRPDFSDYDPDPLFSKSFSVNAYGRTWDIRIRSGQSFRTVTAQSQPTFILAGGILIDTLLLTLFLLLARANRRTISFADELAERFRMKAQDLAKANMDLEDFAYAASHDLKAPLRVIDNVSKWLEEDLRDRMDDNNMTDMELLRGRVKRMERLLDDLLDYSRVGRCTDERFRETVPANTVIRDVLFQLAPPDNFTIEIAPAFSEIFVYRMPFQQVLFNLISNAIKHHDKTDARISISVEEDRGAGVLNIIVSDNGPGIGPEFHDQIFRLFQTLKPRDQVEGSGIGLAIVNKVVDRFGGAICVSSNGVDGTSFILSWPSLPDNEIAVAQADARFYTALQGDVTATLECEVA